MYTVWHVDKYKITFKLVINKEDSGWNCYSILTLLGNGHQNLHETYQCRIYSRELLMMGTGDARNM